MKIGDHLSLSYRSLARHRLRTLLTMLGIAGVLTGSYDLSLAPLPEDVRELYEPDAEVSDAEVQLLEAQVTNPYRRPMAAANVVVSALVLIGSFMLSWRRRLAQWWIKQAVTAKVIWIAAYTATLGHHIQQTLSASTLEEAGTTGSAIVGVLVVFSFVSVLGRFNRSAGEGICFSLFRGLRIFDRF